MPIVDINGNAVEFPDDLTGDALNAAVKMAAGQMAMQPRQPETAERGVGEQVQRVVGLAGQGINNSVGALVGAIPDAVTYGLRQADRLVSSLRPEGAKPLLPDIPLPEPGAYTRGAQGALNALGRNDTPENTLEKAAYGVGEGVGNAASVFMPAAAVTQAARAGGMAQGVAGRLAAQPTMQAVAGSAGGGVGEATDNPWLGAAASLAVPVGAMAARGVVSPGAIRPNEETRRLAGAAQAEHNIPLTPGQITGSTPLRTLESVFKTLPSTAGKAQRIAETQKLAFDKAALAKAGENDATLATPDVIRGMLDRAGQTIASVAERNTLQVTPEAMQSVNALARETVRTMPKGEARPLMARVEDFIDKIDTKTFTVDGKAYQQLDSALSRQARGTMDGNIRESLRGLRDTLRTAMDASISGEDAQIWQEARRHYANAKTIQKAMNSQNVDTVAGHIPPAALSNAVAQGPANNFAMGRGDLNDLSRIGRAFIQDPINNSGTAQRLAYQGALTGSIYSGGNVMSPEMLIGAVGGLAIPKAVQMAYHSRPGQAYLTNRLADRILPRVTPGLLGAVSAGQARSLLDR